ncbi:MAG TPA: M48 family metalloprotease, partial [Elusimicrobiota bacterium]|nr:M48 family metalloprotease [Elusimicrobiota bacterium]
MDLRRRAPIPGRIQPMSLLRRALGPFLSLGLVLSSVPLPVWSAQRIAAPGARVQAELPPALGSTPAAFADQLGLELSALSALAGGLETAPASAAPESAASPAPSLALPAALPEEGSLRREVYRALDRAFDDSRAAQALLESARAGAAPGDAQAADAAARKLSEFLESRRADPGLRAWVRELAGPERAAEAAAGFDGSRLLRGEPSSLSRILDFYHPERARAAAAPAPLGLAAPLGGAQDAAAAPAAPETTPPPVAAASADPVAVRFGGWLGWVSPLKLIANVLDLLHMFALRRLMRKLINRLYIPGDSREYSVELIAKPEPNAYIWPEKALMGVYLGLLPFVRNLDEFASVLAHEMTHQNKEHLKAATDTEDVRRFLDNLEGYSDMDAGQREEMRADLGSLDRMIKSGFNPWAAYEFEKRITAFQSKLFSLKILKHLFRIILGRSFDYWEAHPAGEVRMKAMKAYIIHRGFREDLSKVTENGFQSLPWGVRLIRFWMILPTFLFTSPWMWRLYLAYLSYNVVFMVIALFDTSAAHVARENADAAVNATKGFFSLLWDSAYQNVLTPIGHFLSPIWSRFLGPILGGLWLLVKEAGAGLLKLYMLPFQLLFPKLKPMEAVFVGFVGSLLYMARRMGIAKDATYKNFAAAKDGLRTVRRSFRKLAAKGRLDDALLVRHLALAESRLHDLEEVHRRGGFIRKLSELTGLDWLRWRWRSFHKELLSELSSRLSKRDPEGRAALYALARPQLDRVPGFLLEYSAERKLLERIAAQGGGTRAPPARRYRGHALAAPLSELRLSLLGSADALPAQAGPADILRLVEQLRRAGLVDTARKVFDRNYARTLDFVLSEDSPDGASLRIWLESENDFRARASLWKVGFPARAWRDWKLFLAGLRGVGRDLAWRMAYTAMAHKVPRAVWPWVSPRWWADLVGRFLIRRELGRLHSSVAGLKAFADRLASARHVDLEPLSIEFHRVLVGHPGWVVGREDLDALVAAEYFWPKFGGNSPGFLETLLVEAVKKLSEKYPDRWKYEPGSSEKLHGVYLAGLARLGLSPADWEGRLELWKTLTDRGVTSRTDAMFAELYAGAPAARRLEVEDLALREGRVWEQGLKASIVERRLKEGAAFRALLVEKDPGPRRALLRAVIDELQKDYPERGLYYERILEGVSREIRSDMAESALIHEAKNPATGERGEDLGLRVLSDMLQTAHGWSRRQQWRLVLFLRGDAPPTRKIRRAFRVVGTERVRRMFEILPVLGRTELLDAFLDSPQGLAGTIDLRRGYGRRILEHVLPKGDPEARRVAYEVLESFLYALKRTTGSSGLQSYVLAYMLSMPKTEASSVGNILKGILEIFGATGVKIGQFLAASQLLPEEETRILRGLQEQALEPEREHMYQDLREITGRNDLPFAVEDLLGAASIKYAFSARELGAGQKVVLKVFRLSAMAHTPTEFTLLGHMAKRLRRHGPQYGIFQA